MPACEELATGATVIFYGQALAQVYSAMDEVARVLAQQG